MYPGIYELLEPLESGDRFEPGVKKVLAMMRQRAIWALKNLDAKEARMILRQARTDLDSMTAKQSSPKLR
jgi:hypothetical protein